MPDVAAQWHPDCRHGRREEWQKQIAPEDPSSLKRIANETTSSIAPILLIELSSPFVPIFYMHHRYMMSDSRHLAKKTCRLSYFVEPILFGRNSSILVLSDHWPVMDSLKTKDKHIFYGQADRKGGGVIPTWPDRKHLWKCQPVFFWWN